MAEPIEKKDVQELISEIGTLGDEIVELREILSKLLDKFDALL